MPWGPGRWRERGSWGEGPPPWWPEGEAWPPPPEAWRAMRGRFARRAALFGIGMLILFVLFGAGVVWLIGTLAGSGWAGALGGLVVLVLAVALLRTVRSASVPLGELIEAAGRVESGELGTEVPERGPREVRALTRSFNAMSTRLARTEEQRRRLLADVSHELRTPLTVIQGNVEAILDGVYPADDEHLGRIRAEAVHLERLIDDLRTLSLADAGALALAREPVDLAAVVREVVAGFHAQADAAGVTLAVEADAGVPERELDPQRVRQVIENLVANALRHTARGGRVTASVRPDGEAAVLEISDTGSGMTADQAEHAFDRFWRAGEGAGAGLGLAIVRDLVAAHGGSVSLRSVSGEGTTVTCRFG